jgi:dinuclear metal center protein, YbgI/SA1388 family
MIVQEICTVLEDFAPLALQENYDNAGLQVGKRTDTINGILLCIDITEDVIDEAIRHNCNLIISHHPLIFKGLKRLTGDDYVQRCVIKAIQNNIAIYSAHTNLDSVAEGVNGRIAQKIGLTECRILAPEKERLLKLVTFVPIAEADKVREALFAAGAGRIGNYDSCSYNSEGFGTFRAGDGCSPFVGKINELHHEPEIRLEVIVPTHFRFNVQQALIATHPYEEPAFDWIPIANEWQQTGMGMIGELPQPEDETEFLKRLKSTFNAGVIRHTHLRGKQVKKVAVCGGSGASLLSTAIRANADIFVSADFKYHDFFGVDNRIVVADIGHYESEQFTKEIFFEQIQKKLPTFAVRFAECNTNPVNYL